MSGAPGSFLCTAKAFRIRVPHLRDLRGNCAPQIGQEKIKCVHAEIDEFMQKSANAILDSLKELPEYINKINASK